MSAKDTPDIDAAIRDAVRDATPPHTAGFWGTLGTRLERTSPSVEGIGEDARQWGMTTTQQPAPAPPPARRRRLAPVLVAAAAAAVLATGVATFLSNGPRTVPDVGSSPTASAPGTGPVAPTGTPTAASTSAAGATASSTAGSVGALETVDGGLVQRQLRDGGVDVPGDALPEAYRWADARGENVAVIGRDGDGVLHLVVALTGNTVRQSVSVDRPGPVACDYDSENDVQPASAALTDTDGDGTAEFALGFTRSCLSNVGEVEGALVVVEAGDQYLITGSGWPDQGTASENDGLVPMTPPVPGRPVAEWPDGLYEAAVDRFRTAFFVPSDTTHPLGDADPDSDRSDPTAVVAGLRDDGLEITGTPLSAYRWMEGETEMVLVVSRGSEAGPVPACLDATATTFDYPTIDIVYAARGGGGYDVVRDLHEVPAESAFCAGTVTGGVMQAAARLSDSDGDGVGEVTIGWYFADDEPDNETSPVRTLVASTTVAAFEGQDAYLLRGTGILDVDATWRAENFPDQPVRPDPVPDPAGAGWPQGLLDLARRIYDEVVF